MSNTKVRVRVAATSANLGGGFDCMGLALKMYHTITAEFSDALEITGRDEKSSPDNLIYRSMNEVFARFGRKDAAVRIASKSDIPRASGLGSSAACVACGVLAANALLGFPLGEKGIIALCSDIEGRPDNVTPAILGGVTAAVVRDDGEVDYVARRVGKNVTVAVATPDFPLKTSEARAALPESYPRADAVYSLSRAVVTFAALEAGDIAALRNVGDKLHEPYRIPLIKGYNDVAASFKIAGAAATCVSGAGPSVIAFFDDRDKAAATVLPDGWTLRVPGVDNTRARVEIIDKK